MLLFVFYVAIVVVGAIVLFCVCDAFDHILWKKKYEHKSSIIVGYTAPQLFEQAQTMTEETIDRITTRLFEQTKQMTEDWLNVGKTD